VSQHKISITKILFIFSCCTAGKVTDKEERKHFINYSRIPASKNFKQPSGFDGLFIKVWNAQVSDTCLPAGRQQAMLQAPQPAQ